MTDLNGRGADDETAAPTARPAPRRLRRRMTDAATRTAIYLSPIGAAVGVAGFSGAWRSGNALAVIGNAALGAIGGAVAGAILAVLVVGALALLRRQGSSSVSQ